jgi:hypothetical protein
MSERQPPTALGFQRAGLFVVAALQLFGCSSKLGVPASSATSAVDAQRQMCAWMTDRGFDNSQPQEVEFHLSFPTWKSDVDATHEAEREGYIIKSYESPEDGFEFNLVCKVIPESLACRKLLDRVFELAKKHDAVYTGWAPRTAH